MLDAPDLLHRLDVERGKFAEIAVGPRHLEKRSRAHAYAAGPLLERNLAAGYLHAGLGQWDHEQPGPRVIAHRVPVLAASGAGARGHRHIDRGIADVLPIGDRAGVRVDPFEHVLIDRFLEPEKRAGAAVQLPQDPVLTDTEHHGTSGDVDQHPFVHLVEIESFAGDMLKVPLERAVIRSKRDGRVGVERRVLHCHAATRRHPRFGLSHTEVDQVQPRVVAARNPGVAAAADRIRQVGPRVATRLVRPRDCVEGPERLTRGSVDRADEAAGSAEALTPVEPLHDLAAYDDRTARALVPLGVVAESCGPDQLASGRLERDHPCIGCGQEHLIVVDGQVAARPRVRLALDPDFMLPDEVTGATVECLHHVAVVGHVEDPVVHDRRRRVPSAFVHRPCPRQLQVLHVVPGDLVQRTVAPGRVVAPDHQPVVWRRSTEHLVGDRSEVRDGAGHSEPGRLVSRPSLWSPRLASA